MKKKVLSLLFVLASTTLLLASCVKPKPSTAQSKIQETESISSSDAYSASNSADTQDRDALENVKISKIALGNAQVAAEEGVPVYETATTTAAVLTTIPDGPMVPFYFNDSNWAYVEYGGVKGWAASKFFVFPPDTSTFITLEHAQRIALKEAGIEDFTSVIFTSGKISEQLGNTFTWDIHYTKSDGSKQWCLIEAVEGRLYAYGDET